MLEYHDYAKLFPSMTEDEKTALKEDIRRNGIQSPIVLFEGKVLDGRHRYESAIEIGLTEEEIPFTNLNGSADPLTYAMASNFHRRHLGASQRALIAARIPNTLDTHADTEAITMTYAEKSEQMNVSVTSIKQAEKVIEFCSEDIIKAVESDEIAVSDAASITDRDKEEQKHALEILKTDKKISNLKKAAQHIDREKSKKESSARSNKYSDTDKCKIYHCSAKELSDKIEPNSVDTILTDPPYPSEFLHCWDELGELAMRILKPGGNLIAMSGQSNIFEVGGRLLKSGLKNHWIFCWHQKAKPVQMEVLGISSVWKPVIWMTKGFSFAGGGGTRRDMIDTPFLLPGERDLHKWQQQLSGWQMLTDLICKPGQLICDPFLGSGTSALAALESECFFVGCDTDEESINIAKGRLADARIS